MVGVSDCKFICCAERVCAFYCFTFGPMTHWMSNWMRSVHYKAFVVIEYSFLRFVEKKILFSKKFWIKNTLRLHILLKNFDQITIAKIDDFHQAKSPTHKAVRKANTIISNENEENSYQKAALKWVINIEFHFAQSNTSVWKLPTHSLMQLIKNHCKSNLSRVCRLHSWIPIHAESNKNNNIRPMECSLCFTARKNLLRTFHYGCEIPIQPMWLWRFPAYNSVFDVYLQHSSTVSISFARLTYTHAHTYVGTRAVMTQPNLYCQWLLCAYTIHKKMLGAVLEHIIHAIQWHQYLSVFVEVCTTKRVKATLDSKKQERKK